LHGIDFAMPVASAQVKSAVLLAGLFADGVTRVTEPATTRDHTERMLRGFGVQIEREGSTISLVGGQKLRATHVAVPADFSSAAFFMVAGSIAREGELLLERVGMNPTRNGLLEILRAMGADIDIEAVDESGTGAGRESQDSTGTFARHRSSATFGADRDRRVPGVFHRCRECRRRFGVAGSRRVTRQRKRCAWLSWRPVSPRSGSSTSYYPMACASSVVPRGRRSGRHDRQSR
jgi:hypothetical protein